MTQTATTPEQAERAEMIGRCLRFPKRTLTSDELTTLADLLERADIQTLTEVASSLPRLCVNAAAR